MTINEKGEVRKHHRDIAMAMIEDIDLFLNLMFQKVELIILR